MTDETRVLRTDGLLDEFHTGVDDLVVTPAGVDVTNEQYQQIRDIAFVNHARVYLDEEFTEVPAGKDVKLDVPPPATSSTAPAKKADGDTNGGSL